MTLPTIDVRELNEDMFYLLSTWNSLKGKLKEMTSWPDTLGILNVFVSCLFVEPATWDMLDWWHLWTRHTRDDTFEKNKICKLFSWLVKLFQNPLGFMKVCQNPLSFMKICQNPLGFMKVCQNPLGFMKAC